MVCSDWSIEESERVSGRLTCNRTAEGTFGDFIV